MNRAQQIETGRHVSMSEARDHMCVYVKCFMSLRFRIPGSVPALEPPAAVTSGVFIWNKRENPLKWQLMVVLPAFACQSIKTQSRKTTTGLERKWMRSCSIDLCRFM